MAKLMLSVNTEDWAIVEGHQNCKHCPLQFITYNNCCCDDYYKKLFGKSCDDIRLISKILIPQMRVESFNE